MSKAAVQQHPPRVDSSAMNQNRNAWRWGAQLHRRTNTSSRGGANPHKKATKQQGKEMRKTESQQENPFFFFQSSFASSWMLWKWIFWSLHLCLSSLHLMNFTFTFKGLPKFRFFSFLSRSVPAVWLLGARFMLHLPCCCHRAHFAWSKFKKIK